MRFRTWWADVQESLWFVPAMLTISAIGLAALTVWIDGVLLTDGRVDVYLAFGGGAEGARGVLSAIAGSLVTVTGLVLSMTIVALQLASSQFSPASYGASPAIGRIRWCSVPSSRRSRTRCWSCGRSARPAKMGRCSSRRSR